MHEIYPEFNYLAIFGTKWKLSIINHTVPESLLGSTSTSNCYSYYSSTGICRVEVKSTVKIHKSTVVPVLYLLLRRNTSKQVITA
jgi:hypothetical protein